MSVFLLILGIAMFIGLIIIHEFGHFIAARRGGVGVEEFGIFFPPRLYKRRTKGGWNFTINLLPLGGFVKLKGEHDTDTAPGSYGAADLWTKSKIMAAGVTMNLLVAYLLFVIVALVGMPQIVDNQFSIKSDTKTVRQAERSVLLDSVESGSPAARAGLQANDIITGIGKPGHVRMLDTATALQQQAKQLAGQRVEIDYKRHDQARTAETTLNTTASQQTAHPQGYVGVGIENEQLGADLVRSTWSAPIVAGGLIGQFTWLTLSGLGHAVAGLGSIIAGVTTHNTVARQHGQSGAAAEVGGPVLIVYVLHLFSHLGYQFILFVIALISLTLAIMNILPIPALDGGRLWITLISRKLFHRPLTAQVEETVSAIGFIVLIGLSLIVFAVDILRLVHHTI